MPRYFFDIVDVEPRHDDEGTVLESLSDARLEAVRLSGELLAHYPERFWSIREWSCSVRDESGLILFVLHFLATEAAATMRPT